MKSRLLAFLLAVAVAILVMTRPPAQREAHAQTGLLGRSTAWNVSSVASGGLVFVSSQTTTQAFSAVRMTVVLGSSVPLSVVWSDKANHTFTSYLNSGTALSAGAAYTFVFGARNSTAPGGVTGPNAFNFVVGGPTTVPLLWCEEVTGGSE
jgi:hypothetical protein